MKKVLNCCKNMFEVALKGVLKYYFLVLSSSKHRPVLPSKAIPSLLLAESVAYSDVKTYVASDNLDVSGIISTKHFLPFCFFPPSFLPEEYSLGQNRKEWYN